MRQGFTKHDFEEKLEFYYCMKEHPGRFCSYCNPRAEQEGNNRGLSDEEAELSESWTDGSSFSGANRSPTYSEVWMEEEEKLEAIKNIEHNISLVDAAAAHLEMAIDNRASAKPPVGDLRGQWNLYNLEVCPKKIYPTDEYYRMFITHYIWLEGKTERVRYSSIEEFIEWDIKHASGAISPFQLPVHASLEPIPITLRVGPGEDLHGDIIFLGENCLRLRIPRSLVERLRRRKRAEKKASSPRESVAGWMMGWND